MTRRRKPSFASAPREVDFFSERYLAQYRHELSSERTAAEINFLLRELKLRHGMRVLDLGCGSGRHSVALAKHGCMVTGLDASSFLLNEARQAANEAAVAVKFIAKDMRKMAFRSTFDAVVCLYTSFGYFTHEGDHLKVIKRVAQALVPGGYFFIDMASRDYLIRHFTPRDFRVYPDGSITCHERSFDPLRSIKTNKQLHIAPDGRRETTSIAVRLMAPHELTHWCKAAGLSFVSLWGDLDEPYTSDSRGVMILVRKPPARSGAAALTRRSRRRSSPTTLAI